MLLSCSGIYHLLFEKHLLLTLNLIDSMASFIFINQYLLLSDSVWHLSTFVNKNLLLSRSGGCHLSSACVCLWGQSCLICQVSFMRALQEVAYGYRTICMMCCAPHTVARYVQLHTVQWRLDTQSQAQAAV